MKLKDTISYLNLLITDNDVLASEIAHSRKFWYFLNTILRYPSLILVAIIGLLASLSLRSPSFEIQTTILVLTTLVGILNVTYTLTNPDVQIAVSKHMMQSLAGLNTDLKLYIDELAAVANLEDESRSELRNSTMLKYLLIVVKYELTKSNILRSMPSTLFMRSRKTTIANNNLNLNQATIDRLNNRSQTAFGNFTSDSEEEFNEVEMAEMAEMSHHIESKIKRARFSTEKINRSESLELPA